MAGAGEDIQEGGKSLDSAKWQQITALVVRKGRPAAGTDFTMLRLISRTQVGLLRLGDRLLDRIEHDCGSAAGHRRSFCLVDRSGNGRLCRPDFFQS